MRYKVTCVNCKNEFPVEITDRQRHETDFDVSMEYAKKFIPLFNTDSTEKIEKKKETITKVAIAMYEQKCLDARTKVINENQVNLETLRQENKRKNMRTMRGQ